MAESYNPYKIQGLMTNDVRGSVWRKWDLHIHTPASYFWNGAKFTGDKAHDDILILEMIKAINEADAVAFCFMDYWTFDGWFSLKEYISRNPGVLKKKVFPGIELRLDASVDFKLNTHFLLDDSLTDFQIREFLSILKISGGVDRSPSSEAFIQLAKGYSADVLSKYGCRYEERENDNKMVEVGMKTAKITRESWHKAKSKFKDRALIIQPYDTNDGLVKLDWAEHPSDDTEILRAADFFEARNINNIRLLVGAGHETKPEITENFKQALNGKWRPVVAGSDAHSLNKYGIFPSGKTCWLKADVSFAGLKQCMVDPIGRVFIGSEPYKRRHQHNNKTKYIKSIKIEKNAGSTLTEHWFDNTLGLNYGMVSIIGNKGSGKSALADIIALAGNSHCPSFEFLNKSRFKKVSDNKSSHFSATLTWSNGESVKVNLGEESKKDHPERVRYLPQQYLEELCTEVGSDGASCFESELKKVIFSHVPVHERLGLASLDQVVQYQTEQIEHSISAMRAELKSVNKEIVTLESDIKADNLDSISSKIYLKNQELVAIDSVIPPVVAPSSQESGVADSVAQKISFIRQKLRKAEQNIEDDTVRRIKNTASLRALQRVSQTLANIQLDLVRAIEQLEVDSTVAGIRANGLILFSINDESIVRRSEQLVDEEADLSASILLFQEECFELQLTLDELQELASEPERLYQAYLENFRDWEQRRNKIIGNKDALGSLVYLQNLHNHLINEAPAALIRLETQREHICQRIYSLVQQQVGIYKSMYKPIEAAAESHKFVQGSIRLGFDAVIEGGAFVNHLLSMINQGRRGTYYGQSDGYDAAKGLLDKTDFSTWMGLKTFLRETIDSLKNDKRLGKNEPSNIKSQLKEQFTVNEVYDYVFGLTYLIPRLTLQLGGKEITELSPGERGILLLVFYLMLDKEEIPLIIDQPEHNLDNGSVFHLLEPCIRNARHNRQIILVTHNPNVAIVCDAEQVVFAKIDKQNGSKVTYISGAIENPLINIEVVNILEGTWPAFSIRGQAYQQIHSNT